MKKTLKDIIEKGDGGDANNVSKDAADKHKNEPRREPPEPVLHSVAENKNIITDDKGALGADKLVNHKEEV